MSKATKRKHVTREVTEDEVKPTGDQLIVKVICGRGNNLHQVESHDGSKFLVSMPTKFRKSVWIKRGSYVVVEPIPEGNKVQAEIVYILYPMQIKSLKQQNLWPLEFSESGTTFPHTTATPPTLASAVPTKENNPSSSLEELGSNEELTSSDDDLFQNTNHPADILTESSSSDESNV